MLKIVQNQLFKFYFTAKKKTNTDFFLILIRNLFKELELF
jgi:hypothetical protein